MTELVKIVDSVPVVSTLDMWEELEVEHNAILKLVRRYENKFQEIRTFGFQIQKSKGKPTHFCYLDEEQATFLITLMRNSDKVVGFKFRLTREFYRQKRILSQIAAQQQNAQWLEDRRIGKITRSLATDRIKNFIEYATAQGSKKAHHYYFNISQMENKALFLLEQKFPNLRDALDLHQLAVIRQADEIVVKALNDGMDRELHYRDIYQLAKKRVEMFAEIRGQTLIPSLQIQGGVQQKMIQ